jgi:2-dehydro-3-deoxyphosphogluconate aldolase/(4S)-4-hydroxy-2-oxoglutarate aldolase
MPLTVPARALYCPWTIPGASFALRTESRRAKGKGKSMGIEQHQVKAAELLRAAGILPVVTIHTLDQARAVSAALLEGGLPAIELTLRTPVAMEALAMLKRELPDVVVGAGTVLTVEQMQQSIDAGADFLV